MRADKKLDKKSGLQQKQYSADLALLPRTDKICPGHLPFFYRNSKLQRVQLGLVSIYS